MAVTPKQAQVMLLAYRQALPAAITRGLRRGLRRAKGLSLTKYMQRKDNRGQRFDPANPPPGPLGIRSANLARTVRVAPIVVRAKSVTSGLQAGDGRVRYARIHELGGFAGRSRIRARPYLTPGLKDPDTMLEVEVEKEMLRLAKSALRGLITRAD